MYPRLNRASFAGSILNPNMHGRRRAWRKMTSRHDSVSPLHQLMVQLIRYPAFAPLPKLARATLQNRYK
jgi:hypothetical protein